MSHRAETPHLGSSLSCVDILVALYFSVAQRSSPETFDDPERDRVILSKGHAAPALYAVARGARLLRDRRAARHLQRTAAAAWPSIRARAASPASRRPPARSATACRSALGMALAARHRAVASCRVFARAERRRVQRGHRSGRRRCSPAPQRSSNVLAIVDYNNWQATGRSNEILQLEPLAAKLEAFGWSAREVDGHDLEALVAALRSGCPTAAASPWRSIAHTVKGKGVSFMEDDNNWHYRDPDTRRGRPPPGPSSGCRHEERVRRRGHRAGRARRAHRPARPATSATGSSTTSRSAAPVASSTAASPRRT